MLWSGKPFTFWSSPVWPINWDSPIPLDSKLAKKNIKMKTWSTISNIQTAPWRSNQATQPNEHVEKHGSHLWSNLKYHVNHMLDLGPVTLEKCISSPNIFKLWLTRISELRIWVAWRAEGSLYEPNKKSQPIGWLLVKLCALSLGGYAGVVNHQHQTPNHLLNSAIILFRSV